MYNVIISVYNNLFYYINKKLSYKEEKNTKNNEEKSLKY